MDIEFTIESNIDTNKLLYAQSQAQAGLLSNGPHEELELFEELTGFNTNHWREEINNNLSN